MRFFEVLADVILGFTKAGKHHHALVAWLAFLVVPMLAILRGGSTIVRIMARLGL